MKLKSVFLSLALVFSGVSTLAAAPVKAKPASSGVTATVVTDGAMVYAKPDFDASVLATLKRDQKVRVSSGVTGEFAKFHKVRAGQTLGYIADIDVKLEGAAAKPDVGLGELKNDDAKKKGDKKKKPKAKSKKDSSKKFRDESLPILFTRYVGLLVGMSEFNESISGVDSKSNLLIYGLKVTGPDVLFQGPIMDLNFAVHYGAPSYYDALSTTKPSGFLLMTDALLLLPFYQRDVSMIAAGLGPMIKFSNFNVTSGGEPKSLTQLDLALSVALSGGFKINKVALRLEGKYMIGKQTDRLLQLTLQQQF